MIDVVAETLLSMADVARLMPKRRRGRPCSLATIYRWSSPPGCRGIVLETAVIGGGRVTSREALQRFADALTLCAEGETPAPPPPAKKRQAAITRRKSDWPMPAWPSDYNPHKKSRGQGRSPMRRQRFTRMQFTADSLFRQAKKCNLFEEMRALRRDSRIKPPLREAFEWVYHMSGGRPEHIVVSTKFLASNLACRCGRPKGGCSSWRSWD